MRAERDEAWSFRCERSLDTQHRRQSGMILAGNTGIGRGHQPADRGRRQCYGLGQARRVQLQQSPRGDRAAKDRDQTAVKAAGTNVPTYRLFVGRAGKGAGAVTGGAIECGPFCTDRLDAGTQVTLRAAPLRGSRFVRWLGACRGTRPTCALRIAGPTRTTAVFAP